MVKAGRAERPPPGNGEAGGQGVEVNRHDGARRDEARHGDERLVAELRRRSPEALASLHEESAAGIYSLALRVVRHAPDAEDIAGRAAPGVRADAPGR